MSYPLGFWSASLEALVNEVAPVRAGESPGSVAVRAVRVLGTTGEHAGSVMHSSGEGTGSAAISWTVRSPR